MAFVKKTWKNRVSEFFNRYRVENVQTGAISKVYMNLDDGMVTQEGDVIDADTMNDLEDRIEDALADVGKGSNWVGTTAEWNALTDAEKAEYDTYDLTDDYSGTGIDVNPTSGSSNVVTSGGVANHLVVGERKFYFDYQDGKYGYNTSANRGADTFVPFSSGDFTLLYCNGTVYPSNTYTYTFSEDYDNVLAMIIHGREMAQATSTNTVTLASGTQILLKDYTLNFGNVTQSTRTLIYKLANVKTGDKIYYTSANATTTLVIFQIGV